MRRTSKLLSGRRRSRAGTTIVEIAIASTVLLMTAGATITAVADMRGAAMITTTSSQLSEKGERAMARIIQDLARSGVAVESGKAYPHLFDDGDAAFAFDAHDYVCATQAAPVGDPDHVVTRSIVFLQPADNDPVGDPEHGRPDVDANGQLVWDASEYSYVVVTVNGRNQLQRRVDAGSPETICNDVEWIRFDDSTTPGVNTPLDALRVQLSLRAVDGDGRVLTWTSEAVVRLRNG